MPVSLSPQQQQQVDNANASLSAANTVLQNAISAYGNAYSTFCNGYWSSLTDCDIRDAESNVPKWVKFSVVVTTVPAILASLGLVKSWQRAKYVKPTSCEDALTKGPLLSWKCKRGHGDCVKESTCDGRIAEYNTYINAVYSANIAVDTATQAYNQAKANLDAVLDAISKDPVIAGEVASDIATTEGEQRAKYIKWLLFGLIALTIIIGAVIMSRKVATA